MVKAGCRAKNDDGQVLACLPYGRLLEYTESERDQDGNVIDGTQRVIQVGVDFNLSR